MLSLKYRYFCFGMMITSFTWIIALYLYHNLTQNPLQSDLPVPQESISSIAMYVEHYDKDPNKSLKYKNENGPNAIFAKMASKTINKVDNYMKDNELLSQLEKYQKSRKEYTSARKKDFSNKFSKTFISNESFDLGLIRYPEDLKVREEGYRHHAFNVLVSNRIGFHRSLLDTRNALCKDKKYTNNLPTVSIIICFYNEAKSALLRTVHSVLDRTPDHLIHEILLIDDMSDHVDLKFELETYIQRNMKAKVKLLHTHQREGLIRARMFGAQQATGEILMFLDSHCEVNEAWLEPLLSRLVEDK